ncbi:MAG: hypothetical protein WC455_09805 [Dehalococcoidia bacterium]|jgi:hypothetical protein
MNPALVKLAASVLLATGSSLEKRAGAKRLLRLAEAYRKNPYSMWSNPSDQALALKESYQRAIDSYVKRMNKKGLSKDVLSRMLGIIIPKGYLKRVLMPGSIPGELLGQPVHPPSLIQYVARAAANTGPSVPGKSMSALKEISSLWPPSWRIRI